MKSVDAEGPVNVIELWTGDAGSKSELPLAMIPLTLESSTHRRAIDGDADSSSKS